MGTYTELLARENETFNDLVREFAMKAEKQTEVDEAIAEEEDDVLNELVGAAQIREHIRSISCGDLPSPVHHRRRTSSNHSASTVPAFHRSISQPPEVVARLIEDEELATGKVSYKMYLDYIKAFGVALAIGYFFALFIFRSASESFSQIWMAKWSSGFGNNSKITDVESLEIYCIVEIASCIVSGVSTVIIAVGAFRASRKLHDNLLFSLLRSPMSFFDTTPLGRILNRLSKDIERVDTDVPHQLSYATILMAECTFYTASALYMIPQVGFLSIPVMVIFVIIVVSVLTVIHSCIFEFSEILHICFGSNPTTLFQGLVSRDLAHAGFLRRSQHPPSFRSPNSIRGSDASKGNHMC